jgi:PIN domain nuclease of toxin-antitoxin system
MPDREPPLLLLDTHVWIWVVEGVAAELAAPVIARIEKASDAGSVRVAAISVWEVAMLEARGRLRLALEIDEWVRRAVAAPGTQLVPLSPEIAVDSARLPGDPDGDPADRMLMATARRIGASLVTRDERILAYGDTGHLSVVDATP